MRIVIIGAGEVGYFLSERFAGESHDVVLIDSNVEKLRRVEKDLDVMAMHGSGASAQVLEQVGISQCDLFIAVTDIDEVNLVACMLAREFDVKRRVARVRNEEFFSHGTPLDEKRLGLDLLINPDIVMADEIVRLSDLSEAFQVIEFAHGHVELLGYRIDASNPIIGKSLFMIGRKRGDLVFVIVAIVRRGVTIIPRGDDKIEADDKIYLVARRTDVHQIEKLLNLRSHAPKKVFIIGGGRLGFLVARQLETRKIDVRLIESDAEQCKWLSENLEKTIVLNMDGLEASHLLEEGIGSADLVISVTGSDSTNLLSGMLAKHHGARKCITRINRSDFIPFLDKLGIDVALSSRLLVARAILKFVRRGAIVSVASLTETDSEVLELVVPEKDSICNIPLKDLHFPQKANIGAIVRNGKSIVPKGSTKLKSGDDVIVFALKEAISKIEEFFKV